MSTSSDGQESAAAAQQQQQQRAAPVPPCPAEWTSVVSGISVAEYRCRCPGEHTPIPRLLQTARSKASMQRQRHSVATSGESSGQRLDRVTRTRSRMYVHALPWWILTTARSVCEAREQHCWRRQPALACGTCSLTARLGMDYSRARCRRPRLTQGASCKRWYL